jgi:hypothetical protein
MNVNTLFPSKAEEGRVKGCIVLVKLKKLSKDGGLKLKLSYKERSGVAWLTATLLKWTYSRSSRISTRIQELERP